MKTEIGNLLEVPRGILVHQVNTRGATGGLAGALRRKYPEAFLPYSKACAMFSTGSLLGSTVIGVTRMPDLYVAHAFGQLEPGANTDLRAVDAALADLADQIEADPYFSGLPIFAPYLMGCGLGGGRWADYEPIIEKHFPLATILKLESLK